MKSRNLKLGLFCISLLLFWACEDVIDLDLNESEPQITIEAQLQGGSHTFNVLISKSTPFFEPGTEEKVNNAVVTLIDDQGNDTDIPLVRDGEYSEHITAFVGRQYTLRVEIDGEVYEATSNLLQPVGLVDIEAKFQSAGFIEEDDGYEVIFYYEDPVGMDNYYRARFYINDVPQFEGEFLQVLDDSFSDGETARSPILTEIFQEYALNRLINLLAYALVGFVFIAPQFHCEGDYFWVKSQFKNY